MSIKGWIWKSVVAGLAGTIVHFAFMYLRSRLGLLSSFQPYQSFQAALSHWVGNNVPAAVPWLLSFLNGMTTGRTGLSKGLTFGLIGWLFMGLIFFPLIGLGPFAFGVGLGIAPAMLSLPRYGICRVCANPLMLGARRVHSHPMSAVGPDSVIRRSLPIFRYLAGPTVLRGRVTFNRLPRRATRKNARAMTWSCVVAGHVAQ
jgi:hypothetical protein